MALMRRGRIAELPVSSPLFAAVRASTAADSCWVENGAVHIGKWPAKS